MATPRKYPVQPIQESLGEVFTPPDRFAPLAERLRPKNLSDIVGQKHLIGEGKPLDQMWRSGNVHSMILWGPPGTGKTTIARVLAGNTGAAFFSLSAVSSGVKELRDTIEEARRANARNKKRSILFIDEIHRFSKSQQDALLGAVEDGTITLIGATTENPSFEVISPLLSRARVYVLESLSERDLELVLERALTLDEELKLLKVTFGDDAKNALFALSGGDVRKMLSALELGVSLAGSGNQSPLLTKEIIENAFGRKASRYDKGGEMHYDVISAFIKSMRNSDPNAAIYWLARMIDAGEDPEFIARRMVILASEDIGNADPMALVLATSCWNAIRAVGWPESQLIFSQTAAYLASAPKSNAATVAIGKAMEDVKSHPDLPVPLHIRNAPTKLMKELGYGKGYKYAHSEEKAHAEMTCLPKELEDRVYYDPSEYGNEREIRERLKGLDPGKYGK
ncbi:MAG: replication-associated recombination protein A [Bacteroidota bacterium]|nr:replication-associated recombination protein A [Bacteroidota bacterium]MDP4230086.1 replication-associated recombination protein A [Bacteroidota bacterium]MDP4236159.1 replication-associated recombination protein A [Bacteroidota bacterium]